MISAIAFVLCGFVTAAIQPRERGFMERVALSVLVLFLVQIGIYFK